MSILFFLSQTTSLPRLKYSILYSFISELSNSENGISKTPSNLSRKPTRNYSALMLGSHMILLMMFLAVRSFSFLTFRMAYVSLQACRSLDMETMIIRASSTAIADQTFLLHTSFHSCLLVFSSMLLMKVRPCLRLAITVQGPVSSTTSQSAGSLILMGLVIYFDGFVPRAPSEALPQPWMTYASGFSTLLSWSLILSFCCIFTLLMPSTSSMYFLSISSRIFPVTFSDWKILMKSSNPSLCAKLITSSVLQWLDSSWVRSQAMKWALPPLIRTIFLPISSGYMPTDPVLGFSSYRASLQRKQAIFLPTTMLSSFRVSKGKEISASLYLSRGSCWSKIRRVSWSGCSLSTAIICRNPTIISYTSPLILRVSGFSNWKAVSWHRKRRILPSSQQQRLLFSEIRTIWNFWGSWMSCNSPLLMSCSVLASLMAPSGVVMTVKRDCGCRACTTILPECILEYLAVLLGKTAILLLSSSLRCANSDWLRLLGRAQCSLRYLRRRRLYCLESTAVGSRSLRERYSPIFYKTSHLQNRFSPGYILIIIKEFKIIPFQSLILSRG